MLSNHCCCNQSSPDYHCFGCVFNQTSYRFTWNSSGFDLIGSGSGTMTYDPSTKIWTMPPTSGTTTGPYHFVWARIYAETCAIEIGVCDIEPDCSYSSPTWLYPCPTCAAANKLFLISSTCSPLHLAFTDATSDFYYPIYFYFDS